MGTSRSLAPGSLVREQERHRGCMGQAKQVNLVSRTWSSEVENMLMFCLSYRSIACKHVGTTTRVRGPWPPPKDRRRRACVRNCSKREGSSPDLPFSVPIGPHDRDENGKEPTIEPKDHFGQKFHRALH
jgi:hypothetical protein